MSLLEVKNLSVSFSIPVVRDVSFEITAGECVALVGESGCGKSMTSLSITRLPPTDRASISGNVLFHGKPITGPTRGIAYVFQDPMASLNPVMKIGDQLCEALTLRKEGRPDGRIATIVHNCPALSTITGSPAANCHHCTALPALSTELRHNGEQADGVIGHQDSAREGDGAESRIAWPMAKHQDRVRDGGKSGKRIMRERCAELLAAVDLPDPMGLLRAYPCELSGGMCQRVMIAMALAGDPELLIADEPTTALDVTTQAEVMDLIASIVRKRKMSLLLSTHNLGLVAGRCDRVNVLYAGEIVESGKVADVLTAPRHPYTRGLINAVPNIADGRRNQLRDIPGTVPSPAEIATMRGCTFAPRCPNATEECAREHPALIDGTRCRR